MKEGLTRPCRILGIAERKAKPVFVKGVGFKGMVFLREWFFLRESVFCYYNAKLFC